jgi:hypothetical protein
MPKMKEDELSALVEGWLTQARHFDDSDLSAQRSKAIEFYDGGVDIEVQPKRSSVVSSDVADVIGWILPGLLRVFTASNRVAIYEPNTPEEEEGAKQATEGINYIFLNECDGFRVMKDSMFNGLLHGNGPIKVSWQGQKEYKTEKITGVTMEELMALMQEPDVDDILELHEYEVGPDGAPIDDEGPDADYFTETYD